MNLEKFLFKRIRNTLAAVVMSSFLFGCPHPNSPTPTSTTTPQIANTAVVLQDYNSQKISSATPESITLSQKIDSLSPGKIIISDITPSTPQGLLRKVTGVSSDGKTIYTEQASLEEVVSNYSFDSTQRLTPKNIRSAVLNKGIAFSPTLGTFDFNYNLIDVPLLDVDGIESTKDDDILVNGRLSFNSDLNLKFEIENFELKKLVFKNVNHDDASITISSPTALLNFDEKINIGYYNFSPFVIGTIPTVPPIPIIVTPSINVDLELKGSSSSKITATLEQTANLTLGLAYYDNSWHPINSFSNYFNFKKPELPEKINLSIIPSQTLSFWLYDCISGVYGRAKEYASFSSDSSGWQIYAGLRADVGIDMGIFKKFIDPYSVEVITYDKLIASGAPISSPAPTIHTVQIQPGIEGKDAYIKKSGIPNYNNYSIADIHYFGYDEDYLEVLNQNPSMTQFEYEDALIDFLNLPFIPNNSQISSAKIKLYGWGITNYLTNPTIRLKKINSFWNEGSVVWNDSLISEEEISSSVVGDEGWYEWDVTSLVKDWRNGIPNYGIALYATGHTSKAKFCSSEYSDSTKRPILEISYY